MFFAYSWLPPRFIAFVFQERCSLRREKSDAAGIAPAKSRMPLRSLLSVALSCVRVKAVKAYHQFHLSPTVQLEPQVSNSSDICNLKRWRGIATRYAKQIASLCSCYSDSLHFPLGRYLSLISCQHYLVRQARTQCPIISVSYYNFFQRMAETPGISNA